MSLRPIARVGAVHLYLIQILPGSVDPKTAKAFINSAEAIVQWADGRL